MQSLARGGVRSHVIAAGLLYGGGESVLHFLFKVRHSDRHVTGVTVQVSQWMHGSRSIVSRRGV